MLHARHVWGDFVPRINRLYNIELGYMDASIGRLNRLMSMAGGAWSHASLFRTVDYTPLALTVKGLSVSSRFLCLVSSNPIAVQR